MHFIFLGNTPELSRVELESLGISLSPVTDTIYSTVSPVMDIADMLGGTIKIAEGLGVTKRDEVSGALQELIEQDSAKNIAITNYSSLVMDSSDLYELKKSIERSVRFVSMDTSEHELIMIAKQHVSEFNIISNNGELSIAKTCWISDGVEWSKRDRNRPYQDIKRGMLPPKVSRIMVNLATSGKKGLLLDPYCGTGTTLMEAILLGCSVVGSDNDQEAVKGAEENLSWLSLTYNLNTNTYNLYVSDATHIDEKLSSVDYIVTEPYLGPLLDSRVLPSLDKIKNIAKGLDKLYRGSLKTWHKMLKNDGKICMVIPEFHVEINNRRVTVPTISVDTLRALGYNISSQVEYSKPGAVVVRKITTLIKK